MAEIVGKDFCFVVPDTDLVRLAMGQLRNEQIKITVQAVADRSGLTVPQVIATMRQMQAEHGKRSSERE